MEAGEDFSVGYYDGSSWQTVATFVSGTSFNNNQFYTAVVPILASDYDMSLASQFRFTCDASSNADRVYIDAVTVTGLSGGSLPNPDVKVTALGRAITPDLYSGTYILSMTDEEGEPVVSKFIKLD